MFCPWYASNNTLATPPLASGILQIKQKSGLIDYPKGKSAMVLYAFGDNIKEEFYSLIGSFADLNLDDYVCRHELVEPIEARSRYKELLDRFDIRFGAKPLYQNRFDPVES